MRKMLLLLLLVGCGPAARPYNEWPVEPPRKPEVTVMHPLKVIEPKEHKRIDRFECYSDPNYVVPAKAGDTLRFCKHVTEWKWL